MYDARKVGWLLKSSVWSTFATAYNLSHNQNASTSPVDAPVTWGEDT